MDSPLLSILIPTYNGGSRTLKPVLDSFIEGIQLCDSGDIELVVSDNVSTDNTLELLKGYSEYSFFRYSRNDTNVGFARNIVKLTDELARGDFSWVVGDDDYLVPESLPHIVKSLKTGKADLYSVGFEFIYSDNEPKKRNGQSYEFTECSYGSLLNRAKIGNILGAYMGSSIFKNKYFRAVDKSEITPKFDTYQSAFPNAYVTATAFHNRKCAYTNGLALLPIQHPKEWETSDNVYMIMTQIFPALYQYIVSLGVPEKELSDVRKLIIYRAVLDGYIRIIRGKHVDCHLWRIWRESLMFPSVHLKVIKFFVNVFVRKIKGRR